MFRKRLQLLCCATIVSLSIGCSGQEEPVNVAVPELRWNGTSRLKSDVAAADMQRVANDRLVGRKERAEAVFSLFANHVKLPAKGSTVGDVLAADEWLDDSELEHVTSVIGLVPVRWNPDQGLYRLYLFPDGTGRSGWVIYFVLSSGSDRTANEVREFLRGAGNQAEAPEMVEFALCFHSREPNSQGWIESFDEKGMVGFLH